MKPLDDLIDWFCLFLVGCLAGLGIIYVCFIIKSFSWLF